MPDKEIEEKNDYELVQLALTNTDDYKLIIDRYEKKLFHYIQRILLVGKEDSEDILQGVFIKSYVNLNSYNPKYKFSSWIYRIAHNEALNYIRKNKVKFVQIDIDNKIFENLASEVDIENDYLKKFTKNKVHEVLMKLDEKYREVLVLKFIEEKDYNEVSDILHIPVGTVGSLINRAKSKFKELFTING